MKIDYFCFLLLSKTSYQRQVTLHMSFLQLIQVQEFYRQALSSCHALILKNMQTISNSPTMTDKAGQLQSESSSSIILDSGDFKKYDANFQTCKSILKNIEGSESCSQVKEVMKKCQEMLRFNQMFKKCNDKMEKESLRLKDQQADLLRIRQENQGLKRQIDRMKAMNVKDLHAMLKDGYLAQIEHFISDKMTDDTRLSQLKLNLQCQQSIRDIKKALQKYQGEIKKEAEDLINHLQQAEVQLVIKDCQQIRYRLDYFFNQIESSKKIMQKASRFFEQMINETMKERFQAAKNQIETIFQKGVIRLIDGAAVHCTICTSCTYCPNCCLQSHQQQFTYELIDDFYK